MDSSSRKSDSKTVREGVFLSLYHEFCKGGFLNVNSLYASLQDPRDQALALEIYCGTVRLWYQLQWLAEQFTSKGKLNLKNREKCLLFPALYQLYYLERVPHYAIINETVSLAKKYCHQSIGSFLNGILRKASQTPLNIPQDNSIQSLSIRFSQNPYFINQLIQDRGLDTALEILSASNSRPKHFTRSRQHPFTYSPIDSEWASSDEYIQNPTPGYLMEFLSRSTTSPKSILDLCASPGGKLLIAHDLYPNAKLWANDVSQNRIDLLKENLTKYNIPAEVHLGNGETYPTDQQFDLIILDVPCSNSGVLNKRVEARSRLNKESLEELHTLQLKLLEHAQKLLTPQGTIWFMTCSIMKIENEEVVKCSNLKSVMETTRFPDLQGNDGGYGCCLRPIK